MIRCRIFFKAERAVVKKEVLHLRIQLIQGERNQTKGCLVFELHFAIMVLYYFFVDILEVILDILAKEPKDLCEYQEINYVFRLLSRRYFSEIEH